MTVAVLPLFKGDVPPILNPEHQVLLRRVITGVNPSGTPLERTEYLHVLENVAMMQREVAENVARVFAAALHGLVLRSSERDTRVRPLFLEGCQWMWDGQCRYGAEIAETIYGNVPEGIRGELLPPHVECLTKRTRDECAHLVRIAHEQKLNAVYAVTHPYHRRRVEMIGAYVAEREGDAAPDVLTPSEIAQKWDTRGPKVQPGEKFLIDAIRTCEPTKETERKENRKEMLLRSFHRFERWTGWDLEKWILQRMAVRQRGEEASS